jgi:sortase A
VRVRKLLLVIMALAVVMAVAACGGSEDQGQAPSGDDVQAPTAPASQEKQDNQGPADKTLKLTVPAMERIRDNAIPYTVGDDENSLRDYAAIHLEGTGFPWEDEANVYIAGHRLGYPGTDSFLAFYDLDNVQEGDEITLADANGKEYDYKVFKVFEVSPYDLYVTEPIQGKNIVTLQTCTLPDYSQRLIVQAELQDTRA